MAVWSRARTLRSAARPIRPRSWWIPWRSPGSEANQRGRALILNGCGPIGTPQIVAIETRSAMSDKQLLHLVIGGELKSLQGTPEFRDLTKVDLVGAYPDY